MMALPRGDTITAMMKMVDYKKPWFAQPEKSFEEPKMSNTAYTFSADYAKTTPFTDVLKENDSMLAKALEQQRQMSAMQLYQAGALSERAMLEAVGISKIEQMQMNAMNDIFGANYIQRVEPGPNETEFKLGGMAAIPDPYLPKNSMYFVNTKYIKPQGTGRRGQLVISSDPGQPFTITQTPTTGDWVTTTTSGSKYKTYGDFVNIPWDSNPFQEETQKKSPGESMWWITAAGVESVLGTPLPAKPTEPKVELVPATGKRAIEF